MTKWLRRGAAKPTVERARRKQLEALARRLGVGFHRWELLEQALTHRSVVPSHSHQGRIDNERLEFLGDAVLGAFIASWLYQRHPDWSEGDLTKVKSQLVSFPTLLRIAHGLRLEEELRWTGHNRRGGPASSTVASSFEAVLGALYLDHGWKPVFKLLPRLFQPHLAAIESGTGLDDYKSLLQEWCIKRWRQTPRYTVLATSGPEHDKLFELAVQIGGRRYAAAQGRTKKEAEQACAQAAWRIVQEASGAATGGHGHG